MRFPDQKYTDQAERITENAIHSAIPIYNNLVEHLIGLLENSGTYDEARTSLRIGGADRAFIGDFQELIHGAMVTEDALGRSFIIRKDAFFSNASGRQAGRFRIGAQMVFDSARLDWFACKEDPVTISFDLAPDLAIEAMREKSFWISGIENDALLNEIRKRLEGALETGETYLEFKSKIDNLFDELGADGLESHRLQTVFRTNLYTSYSLGQLQQIDQMRDRFPLWRYVAILDDVTRPTHRALNDKIFRVGEGPYPPIDYNCRCSAQHLHTYEVDADRISPSEEVDLPPKVIDFTDDARWKAYLEKKKQEIDGGIRRQIEASVERVREQTSKPEKPERDQAWAEENLQTKVTGFERAESKNVDETLGLLQDAERKIGGPIPAAEVKFGLTGGTAYAAYTPVTKTITFRRKYLRLEEQMGEDDARWAARHNGQPYHASSTKPALVWHEIAHALDHANDWMYTGRLRSLPVEVVMDALRVSGYSMYGFTERYGPGPEMWAELVSVYMAKGPRAQLIPPEIVQIIKEAIPYAD